MLFGNPEGLKTWDELLEIAIKGMSPESRARLEAVAQACGCSVQEAAVATLHRFFDEGMELPDSEWECHPYGKDPLLGKASDQ